MSELKAGRELDERVARDVMGYADIVDMTYIDGRGSHAERGTTRRFKLPDGRMGKEATRLPAFSTDIAAAWEVVEKLGLSVVRSEDGWYAMRPTDICHDTIPGTAFPRISLFTADYPAAHETAPLAICIAALKTLVAQPSDTVVVDPITDSVEGI